MKSLSRKILFALTTTGYLLQPSHSLDQAPKGPMTRSSLSQKETLSDRSLANKALNSIGNYALNNPSEALIGVSALTDTLLPGTGPYLLSAGHAMLGAAYGKDTLGKIWASLSMPSSSKMQTLNTVTPLIIFFGYQAASAAAATINLSAPFVANVQGLPANTPVSISAYTASNNQTIMAATWPNSLDNPVISLFWDNMTALRQEVDLATSPASRVPDIVACTSNGCNTAWRDTGNQAMTTRRINAQGTIITAEVIVDPAPPGAISDATSTGLKNGNTVLLYAGTTTGTTTISHVSMPSNGAAPSAPITIKTGTGLVVGSAAPAPNGNYVTAYQDSTLTNWAIEATSSGTTVGAAYQLNVASSPSVPSLAVLTDGTKIVASRIGSNVVVRTFGTTNTATSAELQIATDSAATLPKIKALEGGYSLLAYKNTANTVTGIILDPKGVAATAPKSLLPTSGFFDVTAFPTESAPGQTLPFGACNLDITTQEIHCVYGSVDVASTTTSSPNSTTAPAFATRMTVGLATLVAPVLFAYLLS
jgi:hypothetical protein